MACCTWGLNLRRCYDEDSPDPNHDLPVTLQQPARARQKVRRPEASSKRRLGLDYLEERLCPQHFYNFDAIARTGNLDMTGMSDSPSINDAGQVAFVGNFSNGSGLIVGDGTSLTNINPLFSHSPNRSFGRFAQINDSGQVLAIDSVSGSQPQYLLAPGIPAQPIPTKSSPEPGSQVTPTKPSWPPRRSTTTAMQSSPHGMNS